MKVIREIFSKPMSEWTWWGQYKYITWTVFFIYLLIVLWFVTSYSYSPYCCYICSTKRDIS